MRVLLERTTLTLETHQSQLAPSVLLVQSTRIQAARLLLPALTVLLVHSETLVPLLQAALYVNQGHTITEMAALHLQLVCHALPGRIPRVQEVHPYQSALLVQPVRSVLLVPFQACAHGVSQTHSIPIPAEHRRQLANHVLQERGAQM